MMLIQWVAHNHGVECRDILNAPSSRHHWQLAHARFEVMYRLKMERGMTTSQIGRLLNRDHTTVVHGQRWYKNRLGLNANETDPLGYWPCFNSGTAPPKVLAPGSLAARRPR